MRILTPVMWWTTLPLLGVLLYRAVRQRLLRDYPLFYAYVVYVLFSTLLLLRLSLMSRRVYAVGYWTQEFVSILFGVAVIWEIYDRILRAYQGVRRLGRALIAALFAAVLAKFAVDLAAHPMRVLIPTTVDCERNLRFMQAILLLVILGLVLYYRVPLGRNVGYLLTGYGLYVGAAIVNLTLRSALGARFQNWWTVLQPSEYLMTVVIWCVGLWARAPIPAPSPALEQDYEWLSRETVLGTARLRARLGEALRL